MTAPDSPEGGWPTGQWTVVVESANVKDRAGNKVGTGDFNIKFTVQASTAVRVNPAGGDWADPNNWDSGAVPTANDDVVIDIAGDAVATLESGEHVINSLSMKNNSS